MTRRPAGFTLVEVLLSAALMAVVAMIVYTLHRTVAVLRETQAGPVTVEERLQQVLAGIGRDLAGGIRVDEENRPFALAKDIRGHAMLAFPTLDRPAVEPDPLWARPLGVEYRVDPGLGLLRVTRPLSGPGATGPFATNVLVKSVAVFSVQALAGSEFKEEWKSGKDSAWPSACKVRLGLAGESAAAREVVLDLPLSFTVESTRERR